MFDFLSKAGDAVMDSLSNVGSSVSENLQSGLAHTFERLNDPEFQSQLQVLGGAMSNNNARYQSALNAYDQRRSEISKQKREDMQRIQVREEKLADLKEGRAYNEQQGYLSNFTPESVQAFRDGGSTNQSVLVRAKAYESFTDNQGNEWKVEIDPSTNTPVENGDRRIVKHAAPKSVDSGTWTIKDGYKIHNKTGEMVRLDGDEAGNGTPTMRTTSGGKPIPVGYNEDGDLFYQSTNPNYVTDSNGMPVLSADLGRLDPMDPTKRQALQTKVDEAESAYQAPAKASADMTVTAEKLLDHKGFDASYGTVDSMTPTIRQSTADAEALRDQLKGQVFLSQRQQLKGQGQITDYESQRAEAALSIATNAKAGSQAARDALKELIELNKVIQDRVSRGVDSNGNPVRHRRARDPLANKAPGVSKGQVTIRRQN